MPVQGKRVAVVMPAYNAENTVEKTWHEIPKDWVDDIILVDDASTDRTVEVAPERLRATRRNGRAARRPVR